MAEDKACRASHYLHIVGQKSYAPPRHLLPAEIILHVMEFLDTRDLLASEAVCHKWESVLSNYPRLWLNNPSVLEGSPGYIARVYTSIIAKVQRGGLNVSDLNFKVTSSTKIEVDDDDDNNGDGRDNKWPWEFWKRLPTATLTKFMYDGDNINQDRGVWEALERCKLLKVLKYKTRKKSPDFMGYLPGFHCKEAKIRTCKLEELEIDVDFPVELESLDSSRMKKMIFKSTMPPSEVEELLLRAVDTLEHLQISAGIWEDVRQDYEDFDDDNDDNLDEAGLDYYLHNFFQGALVPSITLLNLKTFSAIADGLRGTGSAERRNQKRTSIVSFNFAAPNLEELIYRGFRGWDATLFNSCCTKVKTVYLEVGKSNEEQIWAEIHRLESCEHLTFKCTYATSFARNHPFTRYFTSEETRKPPSMWKDLRHLTLIDDKTVTAQELMSLVRFKLDSVGHQPLVDLALSGCSRVSPEEIDMLRSIVPNVTYVA